jgi:hypothetical protein
MDSQADLTLRETALCYLLDSGNKSRREHTEYYLYRNRPQRAPTPTQVHRATTRMSDMGHEH